MGTRHNEGLAIRNLKEGGRPNHGGVLSAARDYKLSRVASTLVDETTLLDHDPGFRGRALPRNIWWRRLDSNQRPTDYETVALTT